MFDPLDVPGYDVLAPLGRGRTWKAIGGSDRARVVLRAVHGSDETRRRLRREAALWSSAAGAHVVAVRDVFSIDPGMHVVVSDYAAGGGLDALLARRGCLTDGEVVTLVVPLAQALAAAHRGGLAHGRVSPGNIVFGDDGRPMLTDCVLTSGADQSATDDIAALLAVARQCLGVERSGPVHAVLASTPSSAASLAEAVRAVARATPIALHDCGPPPETAVVTPSRRRRPILVAGVIVALAVIVGVALGRKDDAVAISMPRPEPTVAPATVVPTASTTVTPGAPWRAIVQRLERRRLGDYRKTLSRDGVRPAGLSLRLDSVTLLRASADRAVVRVVDGWTAYELIGRDGHLVARRPARLHRATTLVLRRTAVGWRVHRAVV